MPEQLKELELKGIGVSPGVAVGPVFLLTHQEQHIVERSISGDEIHREMARFEEALIATRKQLHEIQQKLSDHAGAKSASILDAHLLVVDDRAFVDEIIRGLHESQKNVEYILYTVSEKYADALAAVEDDYLRERAADVRDVARRILQNLAGGIHADLSHIKEPSILIAHDLTPSDTATLDRSKVIGFATDIGSPTSHTAIMARALEIPAIVGLRDVSTRVSTGDQLLIDGTKGMLIIEPSHERLERYGKIAEARQVIRSGLNKLRDEQAITRDGYQLMLSANIELPSDVDHVIASGAHGVGLFRSEYLYLAKEELPSEDAQYAAYAEVARRMGDAPVIIRTLDLGGDKFASHLKLPPELNPFMGWRAIRFCLAQPDIFKTQMRAILRAGVHGDVKIMYPMISNVDEVLQANALLEQAKHELRSMGKPFDEDMETGVMIEVPSAALTAHLIAPHVSFFSLGTNDLVQYTLAVDRVNERIAYLYEPTHPAIMKLIKETIEIGHQHDVWIGVCGEMAGNALMTPLLLGMGVDELSVSPTLVPLVKDAIRSIRYAQAEELARQALLCQSAAEITALCRRLIEDVAPELLEIIG